jgi:hypothetical protein
MELACNSSGEHPGLPGLPLTGASGPAALRGWPVWRVLVVLLQLAWLPASAAAQQVSNFPAAHWDKIEHPETIGWATNKLAEAHVCAQSIGSAALFVVHQGRVVDDWGETIRRFNVHSIRKSFLSALIGGCVASGAMRLTNTLEQLGVDDNEPRLTASEK